MDERPRSWIIGLGLAAIGAALAIVARGYGPLPGDLGLARTIQGIGGFASPAGSLLTFLGSMIWPVAALTLIVIVALRRWTVALLVLLGSTGGLLLGELLLKPLVARPRPSPDLVRVLDPATSYGFPSSTSLLAAIMTGLVVALVPQSRRSLAFVPGMAVVLLIGLARIYVGEHWPTDIAASWCFAGAWLLLLRAVWAFFPALNPDVSRR